MKTLELKSIDGNVHAIISESLNDLQICGHLMLAHFVIWDSVVTFEDTQNMFAHSVDVQEPEYQRYEIGTIFLYQPFGTVEVYSSLEAAIGSGKYERIVQ